MTIERIPIENREQWLALRQQDVTASAAGALFGIHEYVSAFGLWALKSGRDTEDEEESGPMQRGRLLEPVAIELLREMRPGWKIERPHSYYRDPEARIGATPDLFVTDEEGRPGIVQIKSVEPSIFRRKWRDQATNEHEPPLWIAVQANVEASLTGRVWAAVTPLVVGFGLDMPIIPIPLNDGLVPRLTEEVASFWRRVASGDPPPATHEKDGKVLGKVFAQNNGLELDLSGDNSLPVILPERAHLKAVIKDSEARVTEIDNEIKSKLGLYERGALPGWRLSWKEVNRPSYTTKAVTYRQLGVKET